MQMPLMLEKLRDITNATQNSVSDVEREETYCKQLKSRNAKLKLKSEEMECFLKQLMAKIDDKNHLKSHLLKIKEDVLTKSNSNIITTKEITSCYENINSQKVDLTSKQDEILILTSNLEMLRKWNSVLKHHKAELKKNISSLSTHDLNRIYLEKVKEIKGIQVKYLSLQSNIKNIDSKINESLRDPHRQDLLSESSNEHKSHNSDVNIPMLRFSDISLNLPIYTSNLSSLLHTVARPFKTMHKNLLIDQTTHNIANHTTSLEESDEEIFITAPPCQSFEMNHRALNCISEEIKNTYFLKHHNLNCGDLNVEKRDLITHDNDEFALEPAKPEWGQNNNGGDDDDDDLTKEVVLRMKTCHQSAKREVQSKHHGRVAIKDIQNLNDEDDDEFHRWLKTIDTSQNRLIMPVRRHVSLGDLTDQETVISLVPKRWSHQLELVTKDAHMIIKSNIYKVGGKKGNLMKKRSSKVSKLSDKRVTFDPIALLFSAAVEGELSIIRDAISKIGNINISNEDGLTSLHYAIFAEHFHVVEFLVEEGCDVNATDIDGWTPLHCAASCNDLKICEFLIENGAALFATSYEDLELPSDKCDEMEIGFTEIRNFLLRMEEEMGLASNGVVYALYDYEAVAKDELSFKKGDCLVILKKGDEHENEWWWGCLEDKEGYIPRNLVGIYPRVLRK